MGRAGSTSRQGMVAALVVWGQVGRKAIGNRHFLGVHREREWNAFRLHIENKLSAQFLAYQSEDYAPRAQQMKTNKWVPYTDLSTVLIAPLLFCRMNADRCSHFDVILTHEDISVHIPEFSVRP